MTAVTFDTARRAKGAVFELREILAALRDAVDAFAAYRLQRAVPELRRPKGETAQGGLK